MEAIELSAVAKALKIKNVPAFATGVDDGKSQGFELSSGMSYDDEASQWAYDIGTYIGACLAVRGEA